MKKPLNKPVLLSLDKVNTLLQVLGYTAAPLAKPGDAKNGDKRGHQVSTWTSPDHGTLVIPQQGKSVQQTTFQNALMKTGKIAPGTIAKLINGDLDNINRDAAILHDLPPLDRGLSDKTLTTETMRGFLAASGWIKNPEGITSYIKKGVKGKLNIMPDCGDGDTIRGKDAHHALATVWRQNTDETVKQEIVAFHQQVAAHLTKK